MRKWLLLTLVLVLLLSACGGVQEGPTEGETTIIGCGGQHADADANGLCDRCGDSVVTTFDFYTFNDLHGKFADGDNHPGVDELTTFLRNAQKSDDHVILLSAGDTWQGSAESNLTGGLIMTDWMNDLDFTAMALGNHEFDWGEEAIRKNAEAAEFPLLAINIFQRGTNEQVDYCQSSVLVDADGIQIGIIGAIGDCYSSIAADKVEDIYFKTGSQLTALVKAECDALRAQGADFIVYLLHDGHGQSSGTGSSTVSGGQLASYYDPSLSDGYVDLVFEGHTHQQYLNVDKHGVYHLQNRGDNKGGISHVEVSFNTVTGDTDITAAELITSGSYTSLTDDPIVEQLLEKYKDIIDPAYDVIGTNIRTRNSNELRQKVADLYYELGVAQWGDAYDVFLGGGFISVRSPYDLSKGDVTYAQLQSLFPFDNDIVLCSIQGRDLLNKFINTGNRNYYISNGSANVSGSGVDPNETYYVVVDTYTAMYAPNRLTVVEEYETGVYARDLLADFIMFGGYSK